jgi:DnaJ homolog subfamily C member 19
LILWFVLGGLILFAFMGGLRMFERAAIRDIKTLFTWIAALGGLSLALLLLLTGRGGLALSGLLLFGPLLWQRVQAARTGKTPRGRAGPQTGPSPRGAAGSAGADRPPPRSGAMTREEAYQVLGLQPGASEAEIRAAHRRLMRSAHPDSGGSDWVAARVNQARDTLMGGRR